MREPADRVAEHDRVGHRGRYLRPDPVDQRAQPGVLGGCVRGHRLQRRGRRHGAGDVLEAGDPRVGGPVVRRQRRPPAGPRSGRRAPRRRRVRPTCARSRPARPSRRAPVRGRPTAAASTSSGTPAARQRAATSSTGCVGAHLVVRRLQARQRDARARPRAAAKASASTRPARSTGTSRDACPGRRPVPRAARSSARRPPATRVRADAGADPAPARSRPSWTAWVPDAVKETSSGRQPRDAATDSRAASSSSLARRPGPYSRAGSAQRDVLHAVPARLAAAGCSGSADAASR